MCLHIFLVRHLLIFSFFHTNFSLLLYLHLFNVFSYWHLSFLFLSFSPFMFFLAPWPFEQSKCRLVRLKTRQIKTKIKNQSATKCWKYFSLNNSLSFSRYAIMFWHSLVKFVSLFQIIIARQQHQIMSHIFLQIWT